MDETAPLTAEAIRARVDALVAAMTPEEKAGQLTQYFYFGGLPEPDPPGDLSNAEQAARVEGAAGRGEVGSLLFVTDPAEINRLQRLVVDGNRHGIPALFAFDVIHGFRTILPVPIAMAASWDPDIIARGQAVAAREARAVGIHWTFAPMVDIARDPRWGRIIEGAGEDPFLGAAVAVAQVRGFQGEWLGAPDGVIAGPKHFAGYGAALGGRDYDEVNLSDSELWNIYFPPFRAAVEAGAGNVMTAYMTLNGIPATGNRWLFTEVLRDLWGFEGFVVSDANAARSLETHGFAADLPDAAARALDAGLDMEMAMTEPAYAHLPAGLARGVVDEATLDASVRRVLEAKLRMGLFDDPYVDEARAAEVLDDPAHREVARVAAERSAVLLRNEGDLLPLDAGSLGSIAVIGPLADSRRDTLGPWCFDFDLDETVTVLAGIRDRVGDDVDVRHAPGVRPQQRLFPSIFEVFGGNVPVDPEGVRRRGRAAARGRPRRRLRRRDRRGRRVAEPGRRAGLALVAGAAGATARAGAGRRRDRHPGRAAGDERSPGRPALARRSTCPRSSTSGIPAPRAAPPSPRLLFGDVSPGGKLPFTWPRTVGQVPMIYAHTRSHEPQNQGKRYWDEESTPLFPFGHGLGYSRFELDGLSLDRDEIAPDGSLTVSVTRHQHGGARGRRGGAALRAPAARDRVPSGPRAQGVRAGHAGGRCVPDGHVPPRRGAPALLERRLAGLGGRPLDVRRVGRRRLDRRPGDDVQGDRRLKRVVAARVRGGGGTATT